jgi:aspartyl-tRNA(Asn)/glutamyl-tRNA(Gln) amidotransferase subunit A
MNSNYDPDFPGYTPATELRRMIGAKELSPVELMEATLRRIKAIDGELGGYITVMADAARAAARDAEAAVTRGDELGPLHGLPIPIKDLEGVKGVRLTHGCIPDDEVAESDALCVQRVREAGGIVVGKTNTPEYGNAGTTENRVFGPARNPWNPKRTPGGSSGGAAVSVAAGMTSVAQGSDGGGSVRIPCGFSGIYGIKATQGRIPRRWIDEDSWHPVNNSSVGPMTWTVGDAALLMNVLAGPSPDAEATTLPATPPDFTTDLEAGVKGLRIALSVDQGGAPTDPEVIAAVREVAAAFEELGAHVEERDFCPDESNAAFMDHFFDYFCIRAHAAHGELLDNASTAAQLTDYFRENLEHGRAKTAADYVAALNTVGRYRAYADAFFKDVDLLLCPTTAVPAFQIDRPPTTIAGHAIERPRWGFIPFTPAFNLTGNPAANVPCGFSADRLPIGCQIVGRLEDEVTVLAASAAFEEARPWAERRPPR